MKNLHYLLVLFLIMGCTSNEPSGPIKGGFKSPDLDSVAKAGSGSYPDQYLTIHGKDIWVRDAPSTGEVVMKLNEGDRVEYLDFGGWDKIKGNIDRWIQIRFQGIKGWVFGSQTSLKFDAKWQGATPWLVWQQFRAWHQARVASYPVQEDQEHENRSFEMSKDSTHFTFGLYSDGGGEDTTFDFKGDSLQNLKLLVGETKQGAVSICANSNTPYCMNVKGTWVLMEGLDGNVSRHLLLPDSSDIIVVNSGKSCGFWGTQHILIYQWLPGRLEMKFVQDLFSTEYGEEGGSPEGIPPGTVCEGVKLVMEDRLPKLTLNFNETDKSKTWRWDDKNGLFVE